MTRFIFDVSILSVVDKAVTGISRVLLNLIKEIQLQNRIIPILCVKFNENNNLITLNQLRSDIENYIDIEIDALCNVGDLSICANDIVILLGEQWLFDGVMESIREIKNSTKCRVVSMIHDLSPFIYPETFEKGFPENFKNCIDSQVEISDMILMYSDSTISDLIKKYPNARTEKIKKIKLGDVVDNFGPAGKLNINYEYILFVSTIQPRKNHGVLLFVWRKLLQHYGDACPALLLVGKYGYGMSDFVYSIENNPYLRNKIILKEQVSDADLNLLYQNCMFTIYPSLYEGWGLPVAESLARGKMCLVAGNSSLVEIGGDLVEYIDPLDSGDIFRKIQKYIDDKDLVKEKQRLISKNYVRTDWSVTAKDFLNALNF